MDRELSMGRAIPGERNAVVGIALLAGRGRVVLAVDDAGAALLLHSDVREGERPCDAVARMWADETGLPSQHWEPFMRRRGAGYALHFFRAVLGPSLSRSMPDGAEAQREPSGERRWVVLDCDAALLVEAADLELPAHVTLARYLPADAWAEVRT